MGRRSREFERYLASLSSAERAAVLKAEQDYVERHDRASWSLESIAEEQMHGYEDTPAGRKHG